MLVQIHFKIALRFQTKLNSTQSNYHYHLKYYYEFFFQFTSFNFLLFSTVFLGVRKMGGGGVHGPGPYLDGPGPWTGSTEGVHVSYFPGRANGLACRRC